MCQVNAIEITQLVAICRRKGAESSHYMIYAAAAEGCAAGGCCLALRVATCPLRIACLTAMPALVQRAAQNDLEPSIVLTTRFPPL